MRYHVTSPTRGPAYAAAALCAGIVLGLWIPRRVIRRRLDRGAVDAYRTLRPDSAGVGVKLEFAASLSGVLTVSFALTWVALCGGALLMEEYRGLLASRFLHPVQLKHLLVSLPAYAGLVLAGAVGTTLLVALHGWYRLVTQPNTNVARLWMSILLGAVLAGLLAHRVGSLTTMSWLAPLAVFVAGMIAVVRRSDAVGAPSARPAPRTLARGERLPLLAAGLAAATTGSALFLATPYAWFTSQDLAAGVTVLAAAAGAGLLAARAFLRLRFSVDWGPLLLLLSAVALLLPYQWILAPSINIALARLAAVTACSAACVVLIGRGLSHTSRSVQYALSWIGGSVAAGFGLTPLLMSAGAARWPGSVLATIVALAATAGTGLVLILDSQPKVAARVAGLLCVGAWLCGMPSAARVLSKVLPAPEPASHRLAGEPLVSVARQLVTAPAFRSACLQPLLPSTRDSPIWQFDLAGPALDLIILEGVAAADGGAVSEAEPGRRLLKRITRRLAEGGRLLIELPTAPFVAAALDQFDPAAEDPAWSGYRLRARDATNQYEALVFGGDIPALIGRHTPRTGLEVSLQPLRPAD